MSGASIRARTRRPPEARNARSAQARNGGGVRSAVPSNSFKACRYRSRWYTVVRSMQKPGVRDRVRLAYRRPHRLHAVAYASPRLSPCCRLGVSPTAAVGSSTDQARCGCVAVRNPHYAKSNPHGGADTTLGASAVGFGVLA